MLASMESVRGISVPMYTTLRRTTVVFTMVMEYLLTRQTYTPSIVASIDMALLFGIFVFQGNLMDSIALVSCGVMESYVHHFYEFGHLFSGGLERTIIFPHLYSPGFLVVLLLSCIMAFLLNYTVFLNTTVNSALTQTVCDNLKHFRIFSQWFRGLPYDPLNVIGQCLGFLGSGLYAYCKLNGK
ncbi:UDP-N-acetylglucosamine transporter UGNT1 isoform X2 [Phoenix dactylifera]|uniref:UDP-N-acetylglucosamine transporter UGNT1 isoform X2 n=1 Tax=Phoenix dactylifera TaxID=42345 RepID=A0A8B7CBS2_PHODC|nr:UDP-N-acetylglucosamine transporter UGNT1 isoform X2 [Phoenix dactylifera]